ncbi:MAG: radical SAM protein [Bacillota bacterium]|nr:radical SAM protein [Bacillota bacterium]
MSNRTVQEHIKAFAVKRALQYLDGEPEEAMEKLLKWVDRYDTKNALEVQKDIIRKGIADPRGNWMQLIKKIWAGTDPDMRKAFFESFVVNSAAIGNPRQLKNMEKYGCNIPWAILLDPTSACNLHCEGCWAAEYDHHASLSYETLDSIIKQGTELGTYMYIYTGGEPLVRKDDIIRLCEAHPECQFLAFTNGTLIDEAFADQCLRVKNFIPAISVEGFEKETDARRGQGTYQAVCRAMELLRKKKLPFGVSCCYTRQNAEVIGSEEYFDDLIEKGALFAWFFTYMPVGKGAPTELIATAEQRKYMYEQVRKFRQTKPLFTMDFWNDGEYVKGCIAGGRSYLHINANGDIEPCAFIHYSDSNIREKTLLEAYRSPLFMAYHNNQPFNENHLRPCPLLDNNGALADMVHASGARSTDMGQGEDVDELCVKCKEAADNWAPVAKDLWENQPHYQARCKR